MRYDALLIIAHAGSGSILLQKVLNAVEGMLIRGENENLGYHLFHSYQAIRKSKEYGGRKPENAWFGSQLLNERFYLAMLKNTFYALLLGDQLGSREITCYGFREIRYSPHEITDDFEAYLQFLEEIFPNVAFIFNTGNVQAVAPARSSHHQDALPVNGTRWKATEDRFFNFMKTHPGNTFHSAYEDIANRSEKLKGLFEFIGEPYRESRIDNALSTVKDHDHPHA